jgi:hypothetical protein
MSPTAKTFFVSLDYFTLFAAERHLSLIYSPEVLFYREAISALFREPFSRNDEQTEKERKSAGEKEGEGK